MDEIKSNLDREMEQFTDTASQIQPKRLTFEYLHSSFEKTATKKRKLSVDLTETLINSSSLKNGDTSSCNVSITSTNASLNLSSWEQRRLKADLLEASSRISALKKENENQHRMKIDLEITYQHKIETLNKEIEHQSNKIKDQEHHIKSLRKSEQKYRQQATKARGDLEAHKSWSEERILSLEQENEDLQSSVRSIENDLSNEISELNRVLIEEQQALEALQAEYDALRERTTTLQNKANDYDLVKNSLEKEKQQCASAQKRIKDLEFELGGYGEFQNLARVTKERLNKFDEMERKVEKLAKKNKELNDLIGHKLLMEEQIHDLKTRLENAEKEREELIQLRVKIATIEEELENWHKVAANYIPQDYKPGPNLLKNKIDEILQKDLLLANDSATAKSEKSLIECEKDELKTQYELQKKQIEDLNRGLKHHQTILARLQKKLQLVARERDAYKQLLDNYEKDLTITSVSSLNAPDSQIRLKIENLEKTLSGYKDVCNRLEQELEAAKGNPTDFSTSSIITPEHYESIKREMNQVRTENERLRRRKDEIELEMEMQKLRSTMMLEKQTESVSGKKILHFTENPASDAHKTHVIEVEKLQAEIERLKKKCKRLEEGNLELTSKLQDESMMTVNLKEMNEMSQKIKSLESKIRHLKEIYKSMSQELREVVYMLFGFRVDRIGNSLYRISSMYAESPDDYLNFRLNQEGTLDLLESQYYESLTEMIKSQLAPHNQLPAFLSSLTLELFNRTTMCM